MGSGCGCLRFSRTKVDKLSTEEVEVFDQVHPVVPARLSIFSMSSSMSSASPVPPYASSMSGAQSRSASLPPYSGNFFGVSEDALCDSPSDVGEMSESTSASPSTPPAGGNFSAPAFRGSIRDLLRVEPGCSDPPCDRSVTSTDLALSSPRMSLTESVLPPPTNRGSIRDLRRVEPVCSDALGDRSLTSTDLAVSSPRMSLSESALPPPTNPPSPPCTNRRGSNKKSSRPQSCHSISSPRGTPSGFFTGNMSEEVLPHSEHLTSYLGKVTRNRGSLNLCSMKVQVMQAWDSLDQVYRDLPKPDRQMPAFEAKVDADNLLEQLPANSLKPDQVILQRVCLLGTEWLAIRLIHGSSEQRLQFCSCASTLLNTGRSTCRSVIVQTCDGIGDMVCFACAAMSSSWLDFAEDISELVDIVLKEAKHPCKKDLRKWAEKPRSPMKGGAARTSSFFLGGSVIALAG